MHDSARKPIRIYFTLSVGLAIWALLFWQYFHDGVPSHYILHRTDLPSITNWWGGLLLPVLSWFLVGRIFKRDSGTFKKSVYYGFIGALLYGVGLSVSFVSGLSQIASLMGPGLLILALFFPIYRAEYVLGFVLGMTYTFGAVLPTGFAVVVALVAAVIYNIIRPIPFYIARKVKGSGEASIDT